jgi:hypothetical protein
MRGGGRGAPAVPLVRILVRSSTILVALEWLNNVYAVINLYLQDVAGEGQQVSAASKCKPWDVFTILQVQKEDSTGG